METHARRVKKSQNFLVNKKIVDFIVRSADLSPDDIVLEVGPGKGILTKKLLEKSQVVAIEIDEKLCEFLRMKFHDFIKNGKLVLICGDALKVEFPKFDKIIANIPYHISSPLLFKILKHDFSYGILMLQREFGERLCAKPGSKYYGRLSVMMYYNGRAEILREVKRENFRPMPKVDSVIVKIKKRERFCFTPDKLEDVVRRIFSQRRKKIKNILGDVPHGEKRAEELTPEEICEVAKYVYNRIRD